jgi:hypothetical protein
MRFILLIMAALAAGFLLGLFASKTEQLCGLKLGAIQQPSAVKGGRLKRE